jgi:hypothetical protein
MLFFRVRQMRYVLLAAREVFEDESKYARQDEYWSDPKIAIWLQNMLVRIDITVASTLRGSKGAKSMRVCLDKSWCVLTMLVLLLKQRKCDNYQELPSNHPNVQPPHYLLSSLRAPWHQITLGFSRQRTQYIISSSYRHKPLA